ncbi:MAG TPA: hypothetical protein VGR76_18425 [Candidatus Angelobacter sp.]|jgi:hypothetical protein|nr:hypothetical protein [Candidatus Angelobacter sp.]
MTVTFADGTRIEVAATAYNDFVRHDLKWAEFVHGRATVKKPACTERSTVLAPHCGDARHQNVHPCLAGGC